MLSTLTDIANYALNVLNAGTIASVDGTDRLAAICSKYMDTAFASVISEGEFTGCRNRKTLDSSTQDPVTGWGYRYLLPARYPGADGYIKAMMLESGLDFYVENWELNTDDAAPILIFLYRPTNLQRYQEFVLDAVAYKLAEIISIEISADMNKKMMVEQESRVMLRRAKAHSLQEKNGIKRRGSTWNDFNDGVASVVGRTRNGF